LCGKEGLFGCGVFCGGVEKSGRWWVYGQGWGEKWVRMECGIRDGEDRRMSFVPERWEGGVGLVDRG